MHGLTKLNCSSDAPAIEIIQQNHKYVLFRVCVWLMIQAIVSVLRALWQKTQMFEINHAVEKLLRFNFNYISVSIEVSAQVSQFLNQNCLHKIYCCLHTPHNRWVLEGDLWIVDSRCVFSAKLSFDTYTQFQSLMWNIMSHCIYTIACRYIAKRDLTIVNKRITENVPFTMARAGSMGTI